MRTIRDVMHEDIDVLRTTETAADAARYLATHVDDAVPLCLSDGSLAGDGQQPGHRGPGRAPRIATRARRQPGRVRGPGDVVALDIEVSLEDAVALMCRHRRARLPVLDEERVVGFVTQRDVARSISFQAPWADS